MQTLRWKELNDVAHADPNLNVVSQQMERQPAVNIPCPPVIGVPSDTTEHYLQTTKQRQVTIRRSKREIDKNASCPSYSSMHLHSFLGFLDLELVYTLSRDIFSKCKVNIGMYL